MIAHGIITAPRPRETLSASVESLRAAGFCDEIVISSDDSSMLGMTLTTVVLNAVPLGNLRNWASCLQLLLDRTDDPWLCVSEDDVTWVPGCRQALENDLGLLGISGKIRTVGALSLYFPIAMSQTIETNGEPLPAGWHEATRGLKTWGAQCLLFSRRMAEDLMQSVHMRAYLSDPKWTKNVDGIVADVLFKHSLSILYRVPCLVNHDLGEGNSSLGYADNRPRLKTRYFTGSM